MIVRFMQGKSWSQGKIRKIDQNYEKFDFLHESNLFFTFFDIFTNFSYEIIYNLDKMGSCFPRINGVIWNTSNVAIQYLIYGDFQQKTSEDEKLTIDPTLKIDEQGLEGHGVKFDEQIKKKHKYSRSFVTVLPHNYSYISLRNLQPGANKITIQTSSTQSHKIALLKDVTINSSFEVNLKILMNLSIVPLSKEEIQELNEQGQKMRNRFISEEYIVKKSDTIDTIAQEFDISVRDIMKINQISNVKEMYAGQKLYLRKTHKK